LIWLRQLTHQVITFSFLIIYLKVLDLFLYIIELRDIAVARPIRTKSDAAKLDGEVFSSGVPSCPSPPCTGRAVSFSKIGDSI
jgi:hypothetical protein